jgi:RNA polymerase sigma-70 factor (ECF subfamily)
MNQSGNNLTDQQLIAQTLDGQTAAFGILVRKYQDRLFNSMVHLLRNPADAEDVVQDAFLQALRKLDTFQGNSQFYTWLFRIARNTAISKLRRRKPTVSLESTDSQQRLDFPDDGPTPATEMERRERQTGLMRAMDRLSSEHRAILILREMEEQNYETISEILDLPVGTVRSRLHRARLQLKEFLLQTEDDDQQNHSKSVNGKT